MGILTKWVSSRGVAPDVGLLALRLGIGTMMAVLHGWDKIAGGPESWSGLGGAMSALGIEFAPTFWGFMAAFAEFGCSILIVLGLLFRVATAMLAFTMLVAAVHHMGLPPESGASGWMGASHALELLTVYVALLLTGPGRFALGARMGAHKPDAHGAV